MELMTTEEPPLLSIGIDVGGSSAANHLVQEALASVRKDVMARRTSYPNEGLRVNVVFHVAGPLSQPDYEGAYASRYVRKTNHLLVNAAVPADLRFDEVPSFFRLTLRTVKDEAKRYLQKRKIEVDDRAVMALLDELAAEREAQ